jgi:hypothetical protein
VRYTYLCLATVLCLSSLLMPRALKAEMEYVRQDEIAVRLDGSDNRTALPLDPSREYRVELRSEYTFRPVLDMAHRCITRHREEVGFFSTRVVPIQECRTEMPILVNGVLVPTRAFASAEDAAYFLYPDGGGHYIPHLLLRVWGTGKPLSLKSTADFSDDIPSATAAITDLVYERTKQDEAGVRAREQKRQDVIRTALKVGGCLLLVAIITGMCYGLAMQGSPEREKRHVARLTQEIQDELKRMEQMRRTL